MILHPEEMEMAERVGRIHARKPSSVLKADEVQARLLLWLCENFSTVERYRTEPGGLGKLYSALLHASYREEAEEIKALWLRSKIHDESFSTDALIKHLKQIDTDETEEVVALVRGAFYSLPEESQRVLRASYITGTKSRAQAEAQGRTVGAVRLSRHKALTKLKQRLTGSIQANSLPLALLDI